MTLQFPNQSRSFDDSRRVVRFSGYDGMFEVRFFIEADALANPSGTPSSEADLEDDCLAAFDAQRPSIQNVAREIYGNSRRGSYTLTSSDLR